MIKRKVNIILVVIFIIASLKLLFTIINYKNVDYYEVKEFSGIITDIKKYEDKTVFDLKNNKKYRITTYNDFNFDLGDKVLINAEFYTPNDNTTFNLFN